MRLTIGELRGLIHEAVEDCWGGSRPEETYNEELVEDEAFNKHSVLVPDDVKKPIKKWMKAMGLSGVKKKRSR
jgi:hypothetical protein